LILTDHNGEKSIKYCAEIVAKTLDFKGKLLFDPTKPEGIFKKTASNEKLLKLFPKYKFTPFDDAIKITVDWFLKNQDKFRKDTILH